MWSIPIKLWRGYENGIVGGDWMVAPPIVEPEPAVVLNPALPAQPTLPSLRTSLRASTIDGIFAAIFSNFTGGVLLTNFLVSLQISTAAIGIVAATPMLVNLLQPLGAYLSNRTHSRMRYGLMTYGTSRLLWLLLAIGVLHFSRETPQALIWVTLVVVLAAEILGALGNPSWLSWMAALVPARLRGRYFGFRNSIGSLTVLIAVPLGGWMVSHWAGGSVQGYGVLLLVGVIAGLISLAIQSKMRDINPQLELAQPWHDQGRSSIYSGLVSLWQHSSFKSYWFYWGLWTFSVNLSAPFFNIYLLENLQIDVLWVTVYNSLMSAATLVMLLVWGRLSDRTGNRPLLILVGLLVALTPLLWLGIGRDSLSIQLWLPLLFLFIGITSPAIDLCSNNLLIALAPAHHQATAFAITAAIAGVCGATGTLLGGWLSQGSEIGLVGIFGISSGLRLLALVPLLFTQEPRSHSLVQVIHSLSGGTQTLGAQWELQPVELEET